jgi:hypothetical protein
MKRSAALTCAALLLLLTGCGAGPAEPSGDAPSAEVEPSATASASPEVIALDPAVWDGASASATSVRETFDYTNGQGFQYRLTYNVAAPAATTSLINAKPGEIDVTLALTGTVTIVNKSGGRIAPASYLPALYPYWTDPAVCALDANDGGAIKVLDDAFSPGTPACTRAKYSTIEVPTQLDPEGTEERPISTSDIFGVPEAEGDVLAASFAAPAGYIFLGTSGAEVEAEGCNRQLGGLILWSTLEPAGCSPAVVPVDAASVSASGSAADALLPLIAAEGPLETCPFGSPAEFGSPTGTYSMLMVQATQGHNILFCSSETFRWQVRSLEGQTAADALTNVAADSSFSEPQPFGGGTAMIWGRNDSFTGVWSDDQILILGTGVPDTASADEVAAWFATNLPVALSNAGS